jgi:hypothetical protein
MGTRTTLVGVTRRGDHVTQAASRGGSASSMLATAVEQAHDLIATTVGVAPGGR